MKNKIIFALALLCLPWQLQSHILSSQLLKTADNIGLFDKAIVDILKVRHHLKELVVGKFNIHGAQSHLSIVDSNGKTLAHTLHVIIRRPEALMGATFIVISPQHAHLFKFVDPTLQENIANFIHHIQSRDLLDRYENPDFEAMPTGTWAIHPITGEKLPIFIADYILEGFDTRSTNAHLAIPAHNHKDFAFAQKYNLEIKMVINGVGENKSSSPQINKTTKQLTSAYLGDYDDCFIINSDFLNGSIRAAHDKAVDFLKKHETGSEFKAPMVYQFGNQHCSINDLQMIEATLLKENKSLSPAQKELMSIIMLQVQADLLSTVEHFLVDAKEHKNLMTELITESCTLRKNTNSYLLYWSKLNTNESEKVVFKRDINTFNALTKFCNELIDFLSDFASSCPHALANLKSIQNNK